MRLEAAFFSEQPGLPRPPELGVLVVDFDETCTAADTTGAIINAAIAEAERRAGGAVAEAALLEPKQVLEQHPTPLGVFCQNMLIRMSVRWRSCH